MKNTMPVAVKSYADKFAENWKAQFPIEEEDDKLSLDDSLTNLQWLHNINIQDITPCTASLVESPAARSTNSLDSDAQSDNSDGYREMISKESSVDYKNDPNQKPPYSYATLICMAMRETNKTKITLSAIYKWIKENFMYYRVADPTWQNSIRHNLSLNKCFMKVARRKDEPGKGGFWKIDPAYADMFVGGVFKRRRGVITQKTTKKNSLKSSKRPAAKKPHNRKQSFPQKEQYEELWPKRLRSIKVKIEHEVDECIVEEEIAPFSGGIKEEFSWMTILTNDEMDEGIEEIATAHGISFETSLQGDITQLTNPACPSPPPSNDSMDETFQIEPDLDLTIRGIGILPPRENLATPSPTTLTDSAQSVFNMPPSPPLLYQDEHPWAETSDDMIDYIELDDNGNNIWY